MYTRRVFNKKVYLTPKFRGNQTYSSSAGGGTWKMQYMAQCGKIETNEMGRACGAYGVG